MKFRTLVADCPWSFNDDLPSYGKGSSFGARGAAGHYDCMTASDLEKIPLPNMEDDAFLFFWKVAAMPEEAYRIIRAWGFTPKSEIIWVKKTKKGNRHFGMGRYTRAEHETCIIATRGSAHKFIKAKNIRSCFEAPTEGHSAKPAAFYNLIEQLTPGPYVELFARKQRPGWSCLGNAVCEGEDIRDSIKKLNSVDILNIVNG